MRATVRGVSVLLGTATLESPQGVTRISLGQVALGELRGRALVRAGYGTERSGCILVVLEGELRMPNRVLGCRRAMRISEAGDHEVVPLPRLLLPPPVCVDDRCSSEIERTWMARDLEVLAGAAMRSEAGHARVSNLDGVVKEFLRREQEILESLHALVPRLCVEVSLRAQALLLERAESALACRVVDSLVVGDTLRLRAVLHDILSRGNPLVRVRVCLALARAGDVDVLSAIAREDAHGHDAANAAMLQEARRLLAPVVTLKPGALAGVPAAMRTSVEDLLDDPDDPESRSLLESFGRAGVTRLHLESFLGSGELPEALLDLRLYLVLSRCVARSEGAPEAMAMVISLEQERLRRTGALEGACIEALRRGTGGGREAALDCGHHIGGRRWSTALRSELGRCADGELAGVIGALERLLDRTVSPQLTTRHGLRRAWQITLAMVLVTWVPRGRGLLWGEPDRAGI